MGPVGLEEGGRLRFSFTLFVSGRVNVIRPFTRSMHCHTGYCVQVFGRRLHVVMVLKKEIKKER